MVSSTGPSESLATDPRRNAPFYYGHVPPRGRGPLSGIEGPMTGTQTRDDLTGRLPVAPFGWTAGLDFAK